MTYGSEADTVTKWRSRLSSYHLSRPSQSTSASMASSTNSHAQARESLTSATALPPHATTLLTYLSPCDTEIFDMM